MNDHGDFNADLKRQASSASTESQASDASRGTDTSEFGTGNSTHWYDGSDETLALYTGDELAENHRQYFPPRQQHRQEETCRQYGSPPERAWYVEQHLRQGNLHQQLSPLEVVRQAEQRLQGEHRRQCGSPPGILRHVEPHPLDGDLRQQLSPREGMRLAGQRLQEERRRQCVSPPTRTLQGEQRLHEEGRHQYGSPRERMVQMPAEQRVQYESHRQGDIIREQQAEQRLRDFRAAQQRGRSAGLGTKQQQVQLGSSLPEQESTLGYGYHGMQQQLPQNVAIPGVPTVPNPLMQAIAHSQPQRAPLPARYHTSPNIESPLGQSLPGPTVRHFILDDLATAYKKHGPGSENPNNLPGDFEPATVAEAPKESLLFGRRRLPGIRKLSETKKWDRKASEPKTSERMVSDPSKMTQPTMMPLPRKWSEPTKSEHATQLDLGSGVASNQAGGGDGNNCEGRHSEALRALTGRATDDEAHQARPKPAANFSNFKETLLGHVAEQNRSYQQKQAIISSAPHQPADNTPTVAELVNHINRTRNTATTTTTESSEAEQHRSIGEKVLDILKIKCKHSSDSQCNMPRTHRISLAPARQAHFYAQFELTVSTVISNFLTHNERLLDAAHLSREIRAWESGVWGMFEGPAQKRSRPVDFLFPLDVQQRLLHKNCDAFAKNGAFTNRNVLVVRQAAKIIAGWGRVVDGLPGKTFCEPDWLLIERLQGAEKLIQLLGNHYLSEEVANYSTWKLQMVMEIMDAAEVDQKAQKERTEEGNEKAAAL